MLTRAHPALDAFTIDEIAAFRERREMGEHLHDLKIFDTWAPSREMFRKVEFKIMEIVQSKLLIDEGQRMALLNQALAEMVDEIFTPDQTERYAARLLDTALVMIGAGMREEALSAVVAAITLPETDPRRHGFALRLVHKCFNLDEKERGREAPDPNRLIFRP